MSEDRFGELEAAYKEYTVYDQHYEKIGRVDDLFVDESDMPEYIGVKTGLLGMKSTLVPVEIARVNDRRKLVEIAADKDAIEKAPTFDTNKEITPDYEDRVHSYFGLERPHATESTSGGYGDYYQSDPQDDESLRRQVDTEYGERAETSGPSTGTSTGGTGRDTYEDTSSSRPAESLDIPLDRQEDREPEYREPVGREPERREPERREPERRDPVRIEGSDSLAGSSRTSDAGEGRDVRVGEGSSGGMRVHKRIRRG